MKKVSNLYRLLMGYPVLTENEDPIVREHPVLSKSDLEFVIPVQIDPCDSLLRRSDDTVNVKSDIWLLTHADQLNFDTQAALANALQVRFAERPKENLYAGMTDDEIINTIKPRSIQTQSELDAWMKYLDSVDARLNSKQDDKQDEDEKSAVEEKSVIVEKPVDSSE